MMSASDDFQDQSSNIREFPHKRAEDRKRGTNNSTVSTELDKNAKHITCLAILPPEANQNFDYENILLPALRNVLEQRPYYWQVVYSNDKYYGETIRTNVNGWMKYTQVYIIDISNQSPEIFTELGYIEGARKKRNSIIIVLNHKGNERNLSQTDGITYIEYVPCKDDHAIETISKVLRAEFDKRGNIQQLRTTASAHFLSPLMMQKLGANEQLAKVLSSTSKTMEAFILTETKIVCLNLHDYNLDIDQDVIAGYQKAVKKLLSSL